MNDLQGFRQAIERLDQIAADLAVTDSGFQKPSQPKRLPRTRRISGTA